jgi:hypothetical protein
VAVTATRGRGDAAEAREARGDGLRGPLAAVAEALWPASSGAWVGRGTPPAGFEVIEIYAVLPDLRRPRLLVPLTQPRMAAASLRQFNQGMSQLARLRKAAAGLSLRPPIGRLTARHRITLARSDGATPTLGEHLARLVGAPALAYSVGLGPIRPNMKPVLQLLAPDGDVIGYAKVAWNALTSRLVDHEAAVLRRYGREAPATFAVPTLLASGTWNGRLVAITSPMPHRLLRSGARNAEVPPDALREIAERGGRTAGELVRHAYWPSLRARVEGTAAPARGAAVRGALDRLQRDEGGTELAFGSWHGDLAPGNTSVVDGLLRIWDWERSVDGVPIGLDSIHFHYQLASFAGGRRVGEALRRGVQGAAPALERLGVDRRTHALLASLYLLERLVRYEEARPEGTLGDRDAAIDELVHVLSQEEAR